MEIDVIEKYKKAGEITRTAREESKEYVVEGASAVEICRKIEKRIIELGGKPGFPIGVSINEVAAHAAPKHDDKTVLKKGDVVKIDFGARIDGVLADNAYTVEIGTNKWADLINSTKEALDAAIKKVRPGVAISDIGAAIEKEIRKYGYNPITDLSGHTIEEYTLHGGVHIPNIDNGSTQTIEEGTVIAIEPFATSGVGGVVEIPDMEIFKLEEPKPVRMTTARKILNYVGEEYVTLPFCKRWLVEKLGPVGIDIGLRELHRAGILHEYPVLKEKSGGIVSQHEHTVIVLEKPIVTTL
jgi:methionyl aminopeptidase